MKTITLLLLFVILSNCSTHSVKLGKKCTRIAKDNTYEKSYIWIVDKKKIKNFDYKISKKNCELNGEKL